MAMGDVYVPLSDLGENKQPRDSDPLTEMADNDVIADRNMALYEVSTLNFLIITCQPFECWLHLAFTINPLFTILKIKYTWQVNQFIN